MSVKSFDELPRYIAYQTVGKTFSYLPMILKRENVGLGNAYYAMYARYYTKTGRMNPEQVLFWTFAIRLMKLLKNLSMNTIKTSDL